MSLTSAPPLSVRVDCSLNKKRCGESLTHTCYTMLQIFQGVTLLSAVWSFLSTWPLGGARCSQDDHEQRRQQRSVQPDQKSSHQSVHASVSVRVLHHRLLDTDDALDNVEDAITRSLSVSVCACVREGVSEVACSLARLRFRHTSVVDSCSSIDLTSKVISR